MKKLGLPFLIVLIAAILRLWMLNAPDVHEDERHYIEDSQRLYNRDPYISVRYHARNHPEPSVGHPFLYQIDQAGLFKLFGLSVYSARLPNALSGIALVIVLLLFTRQLGRRVAVLAAIFIAISPLTVRFNRNAHLDTVFALWITISALSIWRYLGGGKKYWLLVSGFAVGLTISTKLNGVYIIPMIVLLLAFVKKESISKKLVKRVLLESLWVFIPAGIVAFLLNDPMAYIDGIVNTSDSTFRFFSQEYFVRRTTYLLSPISILKFVTVNILLLSPGLFIATLISWFYLLFKEKGEFKRFLILWTLPLLNILIIHGIDEYSVYGWIPLAPPVIIGTAYFISRLKKKSANLAVMAVVLVSLPFLISYGLYFARLPYKNFPIHHNRKINETFYQDIVKRVNVITPPNGKVYFLPQVNYPLFALREDISWAYYGDLNTFDIFVVADKNSIIEVASKVVLIEDRSGYQDGVFISRKIFKKID